MRTLKLLIIIAITIAIQACSTSKAVISNGVDLSKYSYVVFGKESSGDRELDDIVMAVQNEIAATKLTVLSAQEGYLQRWLLENSFFLQTSMSQQKNGRVGTHI